MRYILKMRFDYLGIRRRAVYLSTGARALVSTLVTLAVVLGGCDARPRYHIDGGVTPDTGPLPDGLPPSDATGEIFAGMTVTGCEEQEISDETHLCRGTVPLTLGFASLAPPDASTFIWEFGDESPNAETPSATHVFRHPGTYTVLLVVAGPFGTISPPYLTQVEVNPAPVGAFCDADAQCVDGLCLCETADATGCPSILQGTCAANCEACPEATHCVDLSIGDATQMSDWRADSCLPDCQTDGDCPRAGFGCRELPAVDGQLGRLWRPTCFPDVLGDVGHSCHDTDDLPDSGLCLSGHCGALGRFGLCTDDCQEVSCPSYSTCVSFTGGPHGGESLCVARCSAERPCTQDPQLACEVPNGAGDLGFTLLDPGEPAGHAYCAPRRCDTTADCPASLCDQAAGGFCL